MINVKEEIAKLVEPKYQKFSAGLLPGVDNIQGVRLGNLRKISKKIVKEDWKAFLNTASDDSFEEIMLQGMVIGYVKTSSIEELFPYIKKHVAKIDNWSTCDSFCNGLKIAEQNPEAMWDFLKPYFKSTNEYDIRFAVVMSLFYYINDTYKDQVLQIIDSIHHEGYYVKMAVAWALSMIYVSFPEETALFLKKNHLDDFTQNKTIQKIRESHQVTQEQKDALICLKR